MSTLPLATFSAPGVPLWQPYGSSGTTSTVQYADTYTWKGETHPSNKVVFDLTPTSTTTLTLGSGNATADIVLEGSSGNLSIDAPGIISLNTKPAGPVQTSELFTSTLSTSIINIDGQTLTANMKELLLNGVPLATLSNLSSVADWSLEPAISTVQMNDNNIVGVKSLQANTLSTNTLYTNTLFATSTIEQFVSTVNIVGQQAYFSSLNGTAVPALLSTTAGAAAATSSLASTIVSKDISTWANYPAISNVVVRDGKKITSGNVPLAGSNNDLNLEAGRYVVSKGAGMCNIVDMGADVGTNAFYRVVASNGNRGEVSLSAYGGALGAGGLISLNAMAGSVPDSGIAVGGLIEMNAYSMSGTSLCNATSAIKQNAASIVSYAGITPIFGSLAGYNYIHGDLGVNLTAGLPSVIPNLPGSTYIYGTSGVVLESGLGADVKVKDATLAVNSIKPRDDTTDPLIIRGRVNALTNNQFVKLQMVDTIEMSNKCAISNVQILNMSNGAISGVQTINGAAYPPPTQNLTAGNEINITNDAINLNTDISLSTVQGVAATFSTLTVSTINGEVPGTKIPPNLTVSTLTAGGDISGLTASFQNVLSPGEAVQVRSIDDNIMSLIYTSTGTDVIQMDIGKTTPIVGTARNQFRFQGPVEILPGVNGAYEITDTKFQILNAGLQAPQLLGVSSINAQPISEYTGIKNIVGGSQINITNASTINLNSELAVSSLSVVATTSNITGVSPIVLSNMSGNFGESSTPWFSPTPSLFYFKIPDTGNSNNLWFFTGNDNTTTYYNNINPLYRLTGVYYTSNFQKVIVPNWQDFMQNSNFPVGAYVETFVSPNDTTLQGTYYPNKIISASNRNYYYNYFKNSSNTINVGQLTPFSNILYTASYIGEQTSIQPSFVSTSQLYVSSINGSNLNGFGGGLKNLVAGNQINITNASTINVNSNLEVSTLSVTASNLTSVSPIVLSNVDSNYQSTTPWFSPNPSKFYLKVPNSGASNVIWAFYGNDLSNQYYNNTQPGGRYTGVYYTPSLEKVIVNNWDEFFANSNLPVGSYVETFVSPYDTQYEVRYYQNKEPLYYKYIDATNVGGFIKTQLPYPSGALNTGNFDIETTNILPSFVSTSQLYTSTISGTPDMNIEANTFHAQLSSFVVDVGSIYNGVKVYPNFARLTSPGETSINGSNTVEITTGGVLSMTNIPQINMSYCSSIVMDNSPLQVSSMTLSSINGQPISYYEPGGVSTISTFQELYTSTLGVSTISGTPDVSVRGDSLTGVVSSFSFIGADTQNSIAANSTETKVSHSNLISINSGGFIDIDTTDTLALSGTTITMSGSKVDMNTTPLYVSSLNVSSINGMIPGGGGSMPNAGNQLFYSGGNTLNVNPALVVSTVGASDLYHPVNVNISSLNVNLRSAANSITLGAGELNIFSPNATNVRGDTVNIIGVNGAAFSGSNVNMNSVSTFTTSNVLLSPSTILKSATGFSELQATNPVNASTSQMLASAFRVAGFSGDTNNGSYTRDINNRAVFVDSNFAVNRLAYTVDNTVSFSNISTNILRFFTPAGGTNPAFSTIMFVSTFGQNIASNTLFIDSNSDFSVWNNNIFAGQLKLGNNQVSGAASFNRRAELTFYSPNKTGYDLSVQNGDFAIRFATTQSTLTTAQEGYLLDTRINRPYIQPITNNPTTNIALFASFFPSTNNSTIGASTLSLFPAPLPLTQFGTANFSNAPSTITLARGYTDTNYVVQLTPQADTSGQVPHATVLTSNTFTVHAGSGSAGVPFFWTTIGNNY